LENTLPPPGEGGLAADVIWVKKYEKGKRKKREIEVKKVEAKRVCE
jgi:hypothetical protein